ncbi:hypothetical protein K0M31_006890 [Melipona bicolor]|uniref:Uncharacterized protein n=1 Tax=Melipona bicolor TaxID=60889 RepID=A0AA40FT32_9HYME|nr:hypothetical protein K0M31_006890 [Melipona bicolor]
MSEKVVLTTRKARRLYDSRAEYTIELGRPSFVLTVHRTVWSALSNSNTARIASASVVNSRIPKGSHTAERPEKQVIVTKQGPEETGRCYVTRNLGNSPQRNCSRTLGKARYERKE